MNCSTPSLFQFNLLLIMNKAFNMSGTPNHSHYHVYSDVIVRIAPVFHMCGDVYIHYCSLHSHDMKD